MVYIIPTTNPKGDPQCPVDGTQVSREGEFCSATCWEEFHVTMYELEVAIIDMEYLPLQEQPWYGRDHG